LAGYNEPAQVSLATADGDSWMLCSAHHGTQQNEPVRDDAPTATEGADWGSSPALITAQKHLSQQRSIHHSREALITAEQYSSQLSSQQTSNYHSRGALIKPEQHSSQQAALITADQHSLQKISTHPGKEVPCGASRRVSY